MSTEIEQALDRLERAMSALAETRGEMARSIDLALDVVSSDINDLAAVVSAPHRGPPRRSRPRPRRLARLSHRAAAQHQRNVSEY